jgi:hydrogenase nickel incorporation protein HypA/HybF
MHELSITQSMLNLVLEQAGKAKANKVGKINLVIGGMTGVVGECVQFYFDLLSKGTPADGAALAIKAVPIKAKCRDCGKLFKVREFDWTCPRCSGNNIEIVAGKELFVESIEVE